jgi:hypothetical protein
LHASDIDDASHWNRGDQIQVKGTIDDVTQGILILKGMLLFKVSRSEVTASIAIKKTSPIAPGSA